MTVSNLYPLTGANRKGYYVSPDGTAYVGADFDPDENNVVVRAYWLASDAEDAEPAFDDLDPRAAELTQVSGLVRLDWDEEFNAEEFASVYHTDPTCPSEMDSLPTVVTTERAAEIRAWCERQPGFADGPEFAPEAILFQPVE